MPARQLTRSADETRLLGSSIGRELQGGDIVLLMGSIGAGKSVIARGIADAFGVTAWSGSPTFTLVNEYDTSPYLYHADLYRLSDANVADLGLEEYVRQDSVLMVEWPERAPGYIGDLILSRLVEVNLEYVGMEERLVAVTVRTAPRRSEEPAE